MRIRYILSRLEAEGWEIDDSGRTVIATKGDQRFEAKNLNELYFLIFKPKEK